MCDDVSRAFDSINPPSSTKEMRTALENNAPYHKHASARQTLDVEKNNKPSFSARGDNRIIDGMTHREICHFVEPTKELRQHYAPDVSHLNEHYITFYYKTSQAKCKHKHKQKFAQLAFLFLPAEIS